ncbi:LysR family transcriptional regulator [Paenibacillus sp. GD4]|uniref:LysR family transcriptional regulator n=1 Tax=Paenibacillus sp. GD4 TaxID=3068890 RepID=UPI0027965E66|nr:LysR family transcriptional regulator [Paenibacillus sp. GD4]MDQ1911821.1 LysR family transcriptional regulator [Paenibacillus sp. GD4]
MLDRLDGKPLRTFVVVSETGSLSRAAQQLGYVQSTVTTHIRLLEEASGRRLLDRLPRGVELTEAGRKLAAYASRLLALGEELEASLREDGEPRGQARLRALESFCVAYLGGVLQRYLRRYPSVELELGGGFHRDTVEAVLAQRADLGIVPADPQRPELAFEPLVGGSLVWVAAPPEAAAIASEGWAALARMRLIGYGSRCQYTGAAEELLRRNHAACKGTIEYDSMEMIKQAVKSGLGVALVPRVHVAAELGAGTLAECAALGRRDIAFGLIRLKHRELGRPAELLRQSILQHFRSTVSPDGEAAAAPAKDAASEAV